MSIFKCHRVMAATSAVVAAAGMMLLPSTAAAGPVRSTDVAISAQQVDLMASAACVVRDGVGTTGREIEGNPRRYKYDDSPYLGARFDSCGDSIKIYFGGSTGMTHYNLRHGTGHQQELSPRKAGVLTIASPSGYQGRNYSFAVQACNRGGTFQPSSCTRWSPSVVVRLG